MRKVGSITCNWNGERFIKPHLEMLRSYGVDRSIVLQGTKPWGDYAKEHNLSSKPDKSEQIIRDNFPDVEIFKACQNKYSAELYNQGLEILKDYDIVLRLDYDMFLTKKDWKTFIDLIRETDYDLYKLDFATRTINYYLDCDHGVMDAQEEDPIAMSPKGELANILDYVMKDRMPTMYFIKDEDFTIHHFRGWKGYGAKKDWVNGLIPSPYGVYATSLIEEYNPDGKWLTAPKEIKDKLCQK